MTGTPARWPEERYDLQSQLLGPDLEDTGPMVSFKSVMDPGIPMRVQPADYEDSQRWWL
jgi:hypothetical protein